ncbi:MAG: SAM-dependent methyltransferase, partial [Chloroflexi bacterium]|nr:SAM-dependent methyltransferase [Chloroflexota bacterium]
MTDSNSERFSDLKFDDFKRLAQDETLNPIEKVGFPTAYREGKEELIFQDIVNKTSNLMLREQTVLEIGPGCSKPAFMMIDLCRRQGHKLILVDSPEMLNQLPDEDFILKIPGRYPMGCLNLFEKYTGCINAIVTYSVLHYIFIESSVFDFVDQSLSLLAEGGQLLIGDIPNVSKRKRLKSS